MKEDSSHQIQRVTLAEQIEAHIRDLIVSAKLGAGQDLPSSIELAEEFGVSRSIVREALKSLQAKGLIEIANGKRARVQPITSSVLVDFFGRLAHPGNEATIELLELRKGIEVQAAGLAARRRTKEDLGRLWEMVAEMERQIGNPEAFLDIDVALHLAIVEASRNRTVLLLAESIRQVLRDTMREGLVRHLDPAAWHNIHCNHVTLITYIDRGDEAGAAACMATHLDEAIYGILTREPETLD